MLHAPRTLMASLIVATAALGGCGGGGDDGDGGADAGGAGGSGLVGVWKADIGSIIRENALLVAAVGQGSCSGPVSLDLNSDGTFEHNVKAVCTFPAPAGSIPVTTRIKGNYSVSGSRITISNAVTVFSDGEVSRIPSLISNGVADFTLNGNTLVLKPALETGTIQTYTRA
jgi:hypothetical protein